MNWQHFGFLLAGFFFGCQMVEGFRFINQKLSLSFCPEWDWERGVYIGMLLSVGAGACAGLTYLN